LTAAQWVKYGEWILAHRRELTPCFTGTEANPAYGLTWWLNRPVPKDVEAHLGKTMRAITHLNQEPSVPSDLVVAPGAGDQRLYILPTQQVVVARQAGQILARMARGGSHWSDKEFLKRLVAAL
jgi:hypothetical protein